MRPSGAIRKWAVIVAFLTAAYALAACITIPGTGSGGVGIPAGGSTGTGGSTGPGGSTGLGGATGSSGSTPTPGGGTSSNVRAADIGTPSEAEQYLLELINRARKDPAAEAARLGLTSVDEGTAGAVSGSPVPPVAMNAKLAAAAIGHSQDMLNRNFFGHTNPDGRDPFDRIRAAGYSYQTAGENIAFQSSSGTLDIPGSTAGLHDRLFVDSGVTGRGHRVNILNPDFREIGLGIRTGPYVGSSGTPLNTIMATEDFASASGSTEVFVLGVVYRDANGNGRFDFGEGLGGVSAELDGVTVTTPASGGYAFGVLNSGTYAIAFRGGPLGGDLTGSVTVAGVNKKVDAVAGTGLTGADP